MTYLDFGYAANIEELQSVLKSLSDVAKRRHEGMGGVGRYHPSIVQLNLQAKVILVAETLTDGSEVYNLEFHWG